MTDAGYYLTIVNYPIAFTSVFAMGATNGSGNGPQFLSASISSDQMNLGTYLAQASPSYLTSFGLRSYNMMRIKAILIGI